MQAVIQKDYSGIEGLDIKEIPYPKTTPLSVIVENKYVPVLPYDWMTEDGSLSNIRNVNLPMIISYGFGGIVKEVGKLRNKNLLGKKVIGAAPNGSAVQYIDSKIPPLLFEVPENVKLEDATTIIGGADAALHAVESSKLTPNDVVLLTGASGGVGSYVIQLLKLKGAKVIALSNPDNFQFIKSIGADIVINYQEALAEQLQITELPTKVIDTVGSKKILDEITSTYDNIDILSLSLQNYNVINKTQRFRFSNGSVGITGYKRLLKLMSEGKIKAHIQSGFSYNMVKEAQLVSKYKHSHGRVMLQF